MNMKMFLKNSLVLMMLFKSKHYMLHSNHLDSKGTSRMKGNG
jgi:hypothetical protein